MPERREKFAPGATVFHPSVLPSHKAGREERTVEPLYYITRPASVKLRLHRTASPVERSSPTGISVRDYIIIIIIIL